MSSRVRLGSQKADIFSSDPRDKPFPPLHGVPCGAYTQSHSARVFTSAPSGIPVFCHQCCFWPRLCHFHPQGNPWPPSQQVFRAPPDLPPSHPTDQGGSLHPAPGHTHPLIKSLPSKDHIWGESNKVVMEVPQGILETRLAGAPGFLEEADELVKGVRGQSTRRVHPKQG